VDFGAQRFLLGLFFFPFPASIYNGCRITTLHESRMQVSGARNVDTVIVVRIRLFICFCHQRRGFLENTKTKSQDQPPNTQHGVQVRKLQALPSLLVQNQYSLCAPTAPLSTDWPGPDLQGLNACFRLKNETLHDLYFFTLFTRAAVRNTLFPHEQVPTGTRFSADGLLAGGGGYVHLRPWVVIGVRARVRTSKATQKFKVWDVYLGDGT